MRIAVAFCACLALSACGYDKPPREFRPAHRDCGSLAGDFVVDEADLRWLAPKQTLPADVRFPFLSIEDPGNGLLTMVLRRRTSDVLAEARTLQLTDPDRYRAWRARVLGEPADSQSWETPGSSAGPAVTHRWQMSARDCDGGWRGDSAGVAITPRPGSEPTEHLAFLSLAKGEGGGLLVQHHVRSQRNTGMSFRGQEMRWYGYAYSDWHRIPAAPAGSVPAPLTAADLPAMPDRIRRSERHRGEAVAAAGRQPPLPVAGVHADGPALTPPPTFAIRAGAQGGGTVGFPPPTGDTA